MQIASPMKWHGGKAYLASRLVALMPAHVHYVEPFAGGLSVLFAKNPQGVSEVVNDLNGDLINFWRVLARPTAFEQFRRMVEATPCSEWHYDNAESESIDLYRTDFGPDATQAWKFFVCIRQSRQALQTCFATIARTRTRRGMNELPSAWLSAIDGLPEVHERLKRVVILNRDALEVIRTQDGDGTLFYLDPPYLHETRSTTGEYRHEMTADQHRDLLVTLGGSQAATACVRSNETVPGWYAAAKPISGRFMLSGYHSPLYDTVAAVLGWKCHEFELPNNAGGGKEKRRMIECVWTNF
jgi:DNA adenine methylase